MEWEEFYSGHYVKSIVSLSIPLLAISNLISLHTNYDHKLH